jgi:hypothetical protein
MKNGMPKDTCDFIEGKSRGVQHGKLCYNAMKNFMMFCTNVAGFAKDDPMLEEVMSEFKSYIVDVVNSTAAKATSESKWEIFKRSSSQLLRSGRVTFKLANSVAPPPKQGTCIGEISKVNGKVLVWIYPLAALSALQKELQITLTPTAVFGCIKKDHIVEVKQKNGKMVHSDEKNRWLLNASEFFESEDEAAAYLAEAKAI